MIAVALMAVVMLATPMVSAVPGAYLKNNEKFKEFSIESSSNLFELIFAPDHRWIPSFDKVNKLIINAEITQITSVISFDGNTYTLGIDFTVTCHAKDTCYDPIFVTPTKLWPMGSREAKTVNEYMYDFSGDLEGTLEVREVGTSMSTPWHVFSLRGTGDFQNVQIRATSLMTSFDPSSGINTYHTEGIVSGWPE